MGEEDRLDVAEAQAAERQLLAQHGERAGGAGIDERDAARAFEDNRRDDLRRALEPEIQEPYAWRDDRHRARARVDPEVPVMPSSHPTIRAVARRERLSRIESAIPPIGRPEGERMRLLTTVLCTTVLAGAALSAQMPARPASPPGTAEIEVGGKWETVKAPERPRAAGLPGRQVGHPQLRPAAEARTRAVRHRRRLRDQAERRGASVARGRRRVDAAQDRGAAGHRRQDPRPRRVHDVRRPQAGQLDADRVDAQGAGEVRPAATRNRSGAPTATTPRTTSCACRCRSPRSRSRSSSSPGASPT